MKENTPNTTQRTLLDSFISVNGIYFEIIRDFDAMYIGYKVLYLEKAITEDCQTFLKSLDKLYANELLTAGFKGIPIKAMIEVIRAFKVINDLYFDNEVKYGNFGLKKTLTHYFKSLGAVNVDGFQKTIKHIIGERISDLSAGHEEAVEKAKLRGIPQRGQNGWRVELDLPHDQLSSYPRLFIFSQGTISEDQLRNSGITSRILELITSDQVTLDGVPTLLQEERKSTREENIEKIRKNAAKYGDCIVCRFFKDVAKYVGIMSEDKKLETRKIKSM